MIVEGIQVTGKFAGEFNLPAKVAPASVLVYRSPAHARELILPPAT